MAVAFACPGCSTPFRVTEDMAGKRAKCPKCLMVFTLPVGDALTAGDRGVSTEPSARPDAFQDSKRYSPEPARRRRDADDARERDRDQDEPRPKRARSQRSGGSALPWVLGLGGAALVLFLMCGGALVLLGLFSLGGGNQKGNGQGLVAVNNNPPVVVQPPVVQPPVLQPPIVVPPPMIKPPVINPPPFAKPPVFGVPAGPMVHLKAGPAQRIQLINGQFVTVSTITAQDPFDPEDKKFHCKLYQIDLQQGRTYQIDMTSPNAHALDPYLRVEDMNETVLARDDDGGGFPNARIVFTPTATGSYVVVATTYAPQNAGQFTLTIRQLN